MVNVTTLVLSHNLISEIDGISGLKNLKKLSLAHNQIRVIPDMRHHPLLEEVSQHDPPSMMGLALVIERA